MHPLLAKALELGTLVDGFTDDGGCRVSVEERGGVLRAEVRDPEGHVPGTAWRCPPGAPRPGEFPGDVPLLPGLSCVAVCEGPRLTVTWPAPPPSTGIAGGAPAVDRLPGAAPPGPTDPVDGALRRFASEGAAGPGREAFESAFEELVRRSRERGWRPVSAERLEGPLDARVVRMTGPAGRRSITLSGALGVTTLVLLQRPGEAGG